MARERSPDRDRAFEMWKASNGEMKLKDIANALGLGDTQIRKWKNQDKWDEQLKSNVTIPKNPKSNVTIKPASTKIDKIPEPDVNEELTEKQRLFCLYYVKTFNATQSAIKAKYSPESARFIGSENLTKPNIKKEIKRLKAKMTGDLYVEAVDVLRKYIEIAFADITDYLKFGQKEEQVVGVYGPVFEGKGKDKTPVMQMVNYVELNESNMVDGSIISEVKQGKDGVSIKLADKMKALEKLSLYFDLFPDKFKREIEEEKLKMAKQKLNQEDEDKEIEIIIKRKGEDDD